MGKDKTNANTTRVNTLSVSDTHEFTSDIQDNGKTMSYTNSMSLQWPTDKWGFTSELRTALIHAASKINGHEDKKELFDATVALGLKHVEAKYAERQPERDVRKKQTEV